MANVDNPAGFRPLMRNVDGGHSQVMTLSKDANEGTAIFVNDIVEREADGNIAPGGTPGTTRYQGVALNYGAASTLTTHGVVWNPGALYVAQDNNDTDGIAAGDLGSNCNAEFNAGSTTTFVSGHEIDESELANTASLDLTLIALYDAPSNAHGANAQIICKINKHILNQEVTVLS